MFSFRENVKYVTKFKSEMVHRPVIPSQAHENAHEQILMGFHYFRVNDTTKLYFSKVQISPTANH